MRGLGAAAARAGLALPTGLLLQSDEQVSRKANHQNGRSLEGVGRSKVEAKQAGSPMHASTPAKCRLTYKQRAYIARAFHSCGNAT